MTRLYAKKDFKIIILMKRIQLLLILVIGIFASEVSGQDYNYTVNLVNAKKNSVIVDLHCPSLTGNEIEFFFPAIIPGHYERVDFGRFITHFTAFDREGRKLKSKKSGLNSYTIQQAEKLYRITYHVSSTYESRKGKSIQPSSGSIFADNKVFAFNTSAMFGYFRNLKDLRFNLEFHKPDDFFGVTSLAESGYTKSSQTFTAESYDKLIDSPVLFAKPDTSSFMLDNTRITIGVYSESGEHSSELVKTAVKPYLEAVKNYVGTQLPVKRYTLLIYLKDLTDLKERIYGSGSLNIIQKIKMSKVHVGALEHGTSSFYFYADAGKPESYLYYMQRTCTHELLHIYSPLNLRSDLVANFDFQYPEMSQHLWLYEGVTDYLSWQAKLQAGLISTDELLNEVMRSKMFIMNKFPADISFTDWSSKILQEPWSEQYMQVYNKGTVTAMFLDFEIMRLTNGEKNLADIVLALSEKFKNKAFKEDEIFDEITAMVHPELLNFFNRYVSGKEKFDFSKSFNIAGFGFTEKVTEDQPITILDGGYGVEMVIERVRVYNIEKVKPGSIFQKGDKILYDIFGENCTKPFRDANGNYVAPGTITILPVIREGKEMELPVQVEYAPSSYRYKISPLDSLSNEQEVCMKKWKRI